MFLVIKIVEEKRDGEWVKITSIESEEIDTKHRAYGVQAYLEEQACGGDELLERPTSFVVVDVNSMVPA